ncbi:MAG: Malonyl CoA-acyl carrier protein transacylase [Myxococcales bacterium]|nr:Malonyl CoA-acyl carrier protein transacylase [Myxococcales bacterium]
MAVSRDGNLAWSFGRQRLWLLQKIVDLVGRFQRMLREIAAKPELPLSQIELLGSDERAALLDEPARRVTWEARGPTLLEQIERCMRETGNAPAIVSESTTTSYHELDRLSARLATLLHREGARPDSVVAVIADRGVSQIVGLLAVLRAGAAYVPISPNLPNDRIASMLEETESLVVLCDGPPPAALAQAARTIVRLDEPASWPELPALTPAIVSPETLGYIIYTSGSTGRPKGVMVTRRNLDAQLRWMQTEYRLGADDRVLQLTSAMFDFSVVEIFWPLMVGAAIILPRAGGELEPGYLRRLANQHTATVVNFVPSLLRVVLEACKTTPWNTVEMVFCGGEALPIDVARGSRTVFPNAELHNQYGPTETTINATYWHCQPGELTVPIGRPVADTTLYILDGNLAPVPPGGIGELWIGGVQLARGYLRRPALTAERFRPNPFAARAGERIYETGDLVRQRRDGALEYVGRSDFQVKVRGFRIELGEIEAVLQQHPQVRAAAVIARDDRATGKILVAYVCVSAEIADLRGFVAERLPEYMVPTAFVVVDELPRSASGKLDRHALPAPTGDASRRAAYVAPRSVLEKALAEIWCSVLDLEHIGIRDNFFALGGHSLVVVRLVARISRELAVELPLRSVFDFPTIAGQAERVQELARAGVTSEDTSAERDLAELVSTLPEAEVIAQLAEWSHVMLDLKPAETSSAFSGARRELFDRMLAQHRIDSRPSQPLAQRDRRTAPTTFEQRLQWAFHKRGNFSSLGNHAIAFSMRGQLDTRAMRQAVAALVDRQAALRTTFTEDETHLIQTVHDRGPDLEIVDLSDYPANERQSRAEQLFAAICRPHDLGREVFRAQLVRRDDHEHLLFLAPHHMIADGFSCDVLEGDLAALYRAFSTGTEPELAPLTLQYRDFCFWQRTLEQRPIGKKQLAFWERAVAGYDGLELRGDRRVVPRDAIGMALDTYEPGAVSFAIEGASWNALERLCSRLGCTPYTLLVTGFFLLLTRWSRRNDVCVLSGSFHRNRPGSEEVIGDFVTPYPLRVILDEDATLEATVRHCHEAVLAHREHSHVAPTPAVPKWSEWSRYNFNYLIDLDDPQALDFGNVMVDRLAWAAPEPRTPHDLGLFLRQGLRGVRGNLVYNAERFSPELAARARAWLGQLIELIVTTPSARISAVQAAIDSPA